MVDFRKQQKFGWHWLSKPNAIDANTEKCVQWSCQSTCIHCHAVQARGFKQAVHRLPLAMLRCTFNSRLQSFLFSSSWLQVQRRSRLQQDVQDPKILKIWPSVGRGRVAHRCKWYWSQVCACYTEKHCIQWFRSQATSDCDWGKLSLLPIDLVIRMIKLWNKAIGWAAVNIQSSFVEA